MPHSSVAGMLGEDVDSKKILNDFLNQVRQQPQSFKKLLLTVALHPKPEDSVIWEKQTFTFGKEKRLDISLMRSCCQDYQQRSS
jgi:hypothetical protein